MREGEGGVSDGGGTQMGRFVWLGTCIAFGWVGGWGCPAVGPLEDCFPLPEMKQLH